MVRLFWFARTENFQNKQNALRGSPRVFTICTKTPEILVGNQMDQKISGNFVRNFRGTSRGTPLFPFGTENWEIPNHLLISPVPSLLGRRVARYFLLLRECRQETCLSAVFVAFMTLEFLLSHKCFEADCGKWLLPYE